MKYELKITPLRSYGVPQYPTKSDVRLNPTILNALPRRWQSKPAVCVALMLTLSTGMCGCLNRKPFDDESSNIVTSTTGLSTTMTSASDRVSYSCVAVVPAVYLSEEEAQQVIREEAEAKGIHFDDVRTISEINFPIIFDYDSPITWNGSLELDGYDSSLGIGFEFVSADDVAEWMQEAGKSDNTCYIDIEETAAGLSEVVEDTFVFYEPSRWIWLEQYYQTYEFGEDEKVKLEKMKEPLKENLRVQVQDYLTWLAAEGII